MLSSCVNHYLVRDVLTAYIGSFSVLCISTNFSIKLRLTRRFILLYKTDAFMFSFLLSRGTEILASLVSSDNIRISSSSNLCKILPHFMVPIHINKCSQKIEISMCV